MGRTFKTSHIFNVGHSIQVYLYSAFHDANCCKAALQKMKYSTLYLVIAYQWLYGGYSYLKLMSIIAKCGSFACCKVGIF